MGRHHFEKKQEEISNTFMSAAGDNGETEMTLQGHKNKVLFQGILLVALIIGSVVLLRKKK